MMELVSSRNLFVDTSDRLDSQTGDDTTIHLSGNGIRAGDGQLLRLSVMSFTMYRNIYQIGVNNSRVRCEINGDTAAVIDSEITHQNYLTCGAIAQDFSEQVRLALFDLVTTSTTGDKPTSCTVNSLLPALDDPITATGGRILSFNLTFDKAHQVNTFKLQCFADEGESYAILGGDRLSSGSTGSSLICTKVDALTLSVQGLYPMQRHTQTHVFLRTDLASSNIETASLSGVSGGGSHTVPSNILGFFELDSEYVHFTSRTDTEFSLVVTQRNLSALRLYLTDSKSRPLGRIASSSSKTAAGPGDSQSTKGNLNFSCMVRIDTLQFAVPKGLKTSLQKTADVKQAGIMTVL